VSADSQVLNLARLEEAFDDDRAGIAELLEMALETGAKHLRNLEEGLSRGDATIVARAAHSIKGSAGNVGAERIAALAASLDTVARLNDLHDARTRIEALRSAYDELAEAIGAYRATVA